MILLRIIAPLLGFLVVGLANLPLSSVLALAPLQAAGIVAGDVSGPVWNGVLSGVAFRGHPVGEINVAARPLDLLAGEPRLAFRRAGISGLVAKTADGFALTGINGRLAMSDIRSFAPMQGVPVQGDVILGDVAFSVGAAGCRSASGQVQIDGAQASDVPGSGGPFAGAISCEAGDLAIALTSADGGAGFVARIDVGVGAAAAPAVIAQ